MPYNDGLLITAQVLSILAVITSWTTWTSIFGVAAFVCLQIVWCCRMNKCGLIAVGVLSLAAGISGIACGISVLANDTICDNFSSFYGSFASSYETSTNTSYDDLFYDNVDNFCAVWIKIVGSVSLGSGILWCIITFCIFYFAFGSRYQSYYTQNNVERDIHDVSGISAVAVANEGEQKKNGSEEIRTVNGVVIGDTAV